LNKTFKIKTINGSKYQILTLPGTNIFNYQIYNMLGAGIERSLSGDVKPYGLSHFIEHLGFRIPRDFSTEELLHLLKTEGTYNASTDHDRIEYFFMTTMDRIDIAITLVCNYTFNTLTNITTDEFNTEKTVVINEALRYADDDQTMFNFNAPSALRGYHPDDNVIGDRATIEQFTLSDAIDLKNLFLSQGEHIHCVTFDPLVQTEEQVISKIESQLSTWDMPQSNEKVKLVSNKPQYDTNIVMANESKQHMIYLNLATRLDPTPRSFALNYLSTYSDTSLTDVIRDKNGLTYGLWFYSEIMDYQPTITFSCDVTPGTEDLLMELFSQSINDSVDEFTEAKHSTTLRNMQLQQTLSYVDQMRNTALHATGIWYPNKISQLAEEYSNDIVLAREKNIERYASYDKVVEEMKHIQTAINTNDYGLVTNR